ncbi:WD repeat-containing protein slp1 [Grifola frondosa]|uniref:WD repeat-containing protein slp1 n=1 Tax=Grifola frondosa TaxID=5627 RepID=A0A1C7MDN2_GRIFR|nr:WD repeat-containing protein slp1 [Grifola frondosa]
MDGSTPNTCVTPRRKRTWTPGSITNAYSTKRRRVSMASVDLTRELSQAGESSSLSQTSTADRFISARADFSLPLFITPRSQRIARVFGLADDRVLKFGETNASSSAGSQFARHRFNFYQLLASPHKISPTSAEANLGSRKQFVLALDGPGIPSDLFAFPMTWSSRNAIAVACGRDVYYQNLDTRAITHLFKLQGRSYGRLMSIEWSRHKPSVLAAGTTTGSLQLWDADTVKQVRQWQDESFEEIAGMSWNRDVLAVGVEDGSIGLYDSRESSAIGRLTCHKDRVHGVRWSHDGNYLASGDQQGVVHFWDARAGKALSNANKRGSKMKHKAPVKALAWCPWKPDLLASGSMYPDGKIRIWSVNSTASAAPPLHTIPLDTSVTSLIWSPHCKELLSTHGISWVSRSSESCPNLSSRADSATQRPMTIKTSLTNSLTVHGYPSLRRIVSVPAHTGAVGHSSLSPDGTMVFTICPAEEAMKMWKVWAIPANAERRESAFDKCAIR